MLQRLLPLTCRSLVTLSVSSLTSSLLFRWKVGQLRPGATVRFQRISFEDSQRLSAFYDSWLAKVGHTEPTNTTESDSSIFSFTPDSLGSENSCILHLISADEQQGRPQAVFRQVMFGFFNTMMYDRSTTT